MLSYRGHRARIDIDPNTRELTGRVECVDDIRAFRGADPLALEADFHRAVDDHLHFRELGLSPWRERPTVKPGAALPAAPPPAAEPAPPRRRGFGPLKSQTQAGWIVAVWVVAQNPSVPGNWFAALIFGVAAWMFVGGLWIVAGLTRDYRDLPWRGPDS